LLFGPAIEAAAWLEILQHQTGGAARPHFAALVASAAAPLAGSGS